MSKIVILRLSSESVWLLLDSAIGGTLEHSSSPKVVGGENACKMVRKHDCIYTTNKQNITFEVIINGIRPVILLLFLTY